MLKRPRRPADPKESVEGIVDEPARPTRPRDPNQLAKQIVDEATDQAEPPEPEPEKNPAAVALGKLGGKKGGKARAEKLTAEERRKIAQKAAKARWGGD